MYDLNFLLEKKALNYGSDVMANLGYWPDSSHAASETAGVCASLRFTYISHTENYRNLYY